jgi:hypothetical protein
MKSIAYPEGFFYVERATVIMFGLSAQLAPKLNTILVGVPYIQQFMMDRIARRTAAAAPPEKADAKADAKVDTPGAAVAPVA